MTPLYFTHRCAGENIHTLAFPRDETQAVERQRRRVCSDGRRPSARSLQLMCLHLLYDQPQPSLITSAGHWPSRAWTQPGHHQTPVHRRLLPRPGRQTQTLLHPDIRRLWASEVCWVQRSRRRRAGDGRSCDVLPSEERPDGCRHLLESLLQSREAAEDTRTSVCVPERSHICFTWRTHQVHSIKLDLWKCVMRMYRCNNSCVLFVCNRRTHLLDVHTAVNREVFQHNSKFPGSSVLNLKHTLRKNIYLWFLMFMREVK